METKAIVLAAGKGTRLHSETARLPKVMREANGKPLLHYVLEALSFLPKENICIVAGYMADAVMAAFPGYTYAMQEEQLGTGHAVKMAESFIRDFSGSVLVCYGDMPLLRRDTYEALLSDHVSAGRQCTLLTGTSNVPLPYGRVERDKGGNFLRVIEDRDCTPEQKEIKELNAGIYAFDGPMLISSLGKLGSANSQGEYYLTDVPEIIASDGGKTGVFCRELNEQILGVNTLEDLERVEGLLRNM